MIKITIDAPDDILGVDEFIAQSIQAVNDTVDDTLSDFERSVATFDHAVPFKVEKASGVKAGMISGSVETDEEKYVRLNNGFIIPEVIGKRMSFQPGYVNKTTPNTIPSRSGGPIGPRIVRTSRKATRVQGRRFDVAIANKNRLKFYQRVSGGK